MGVEAKRKALLKHYCNHAYEDNRCGVACGWYGIIQPGACDVFRWDATQIEMECRRAGIEIDNTTAEDETIADKVEAEKRSCENCVHHDKPSPSLCIYCEGKDEYTPTADNAAPTIADSGNRRVFPSGAVRDMGAVADKGRCDLMPLKVVGRVLKDETFDIIEDFKNTLNVEPLYEMLRLFAVEAYGDSDCTMFLEVAKHFEQGAAKYGENNWQKGLPVWCYIDSAVRHYLKWLRGDTDEPHDRAFVWNVMCCIWQSEHDAACGGEIANK